MAVQLPGVLLRQVGTIWNKVFCALKCIISDSLHFSVWELASKLDHRAVGAINLDGTHNSLDLFGGSVRAPYLTLFTGPSHIESYTNEFFFEPLVAMGSDERVTRIRLVDINHMELSDMSLADLKDRQTIPDGGRTDGYKIQNIMASFCLGFIETAFTGQTWSYDSTLDMFPEAKFFDVSYVAEWARAFFDNDQAEPNLTDPATNSSSSGNVSGSIVALGIMYTLFSLLSVDSIW